MQMLSLGDLAQSFLFARRGTEMKADIQRLSLELTTGLTQDPARHLAGDFGPLGGIDASLARLTAYRSVTAEAGLFSQGMQSAIGRVDTLAVDLGYALLAGSSPGNPVRVDALAAEAVQKLDAALSALNTRIGDRSLFSGVDTAAKAVPDGAAFLATLQGVVAGVPTVDDLGTRLDDWFASAAGYGAAYGGGAALAPLSIAPGEVARLDITAAHPAIRDTLKGLAMAALLGTGLFTGQPELRATVAMRAGEALTRNQTDRVELAAGLGRAEAQIEQAAQHNTAETSALGIARTELLSVDGYEAASRLQATQTQLETLYALTSRMQRLNLVNYL